ncbi:BlaI/MecI/CopY family transcriptional regulator [Aliikangiella marina]|uniref:BlaI/MecI/CopY family transcriptional regulator n=1 Tax=Aliikangiella marina TaxID=1712262 RepID=A0A545T6R5_9GAMM|nr:BlaI/MecI/CopY family transcriptional regulator [Aliikangiella marina]TQV72862.1 BlaI/MecI/CopY family transcriptional regulator [Aliikangiella marina]
MKSTGNNSNKASLQISDSEKLVLDVLWQQSPLTAKAIITRLQGEQDWQDKTIKTLINRLLKKQAIGFEKDGREYLYFPIVDQQIYVEEQADNFVKRMFKGSLSSFVAAFAKKEKLTRDEIKELKKILREIEK